MESMMRQTAQTLRMLLPKEDSVHMRKPGLGFENQIDVENPFVLNKSKELAPSLYNIDEMGKELLSDYKIISEEELKCEAENRLKVKQRKSPLSYHGFVYGLTQFEEPPKVPLKRRDYEKDFAKLEAHCVSPEPKSPNKSSTSVQNDQVLSNKSDETKIKFDTEDLETINIELEYSVSSLLIENEHLKTIYKNPFDLIKRSQVQTKSLNVSQNEAENLKSQLFEFADKKFDKVFQKIESMKKKKFDSQISNDFLQKSLYDSDPSNVESESGEKKILFGNETSSFETKIKELEMTLAQQTKDFEDAKVDFSKKTDKFETYFEKLKNTKVVLER
ncbi:hypothetical protein Tco_0941094 [Tanacetum coccineum]|uniref:Uncharacterized protein n=1 Tax=Tanacetum coccineum TaxID=301880 RepID=A0ABQ5DWI8_9ASTR